MSTCATVGGWGRTHQVEAPRRYAPEAEPGMASQQAFEVPRRGDIQIVRPDEAAQQFGLLIHDEGCKIEPAVGHELGLFLQLVVREAHPQLAQIRILE